MSVPEEATEYHYTKRAATIRRKYRINSKNGKLYEISKTNHRNKATKRKQKRAYQHSKRMKMKIPLSLLKKSTSNDASYYEGNQLKQLEKHTKSKDVIFTNKSSYRWQINQDKTIQQNKDKDDRLFLGIEFGETSSSKKIYSYNFVTKNIYNYHEIIQNTKPNLSSSHSFLWLLISSPNPWNKQEKFIANNDIQMVTKCIDKFNDIKYGENSHLIFDTLNQCETPQLIKIKMKEMKNKCIKQSNKHKKQCIPIIYYSGHGLEKTGNWMFKNNKKLQLSLKDILIQFKEYKSLILISDSCFSGCFVKTLDNKKDNQMQNIVNEYDNLIIFTSSDWYEISDWKCSFTEWIFNNNCRPRHNPYLYVNGKIQNISSHFVWDFHIDKQIKNNI